VRLNLYAQNCAPETQTGRKRSFVTSPKDNERGLVRSEPRQPGRQSALRLGAGLFALSRRPIDRANPLAASESLGRLLDRKRP